MSLFARTMAYRLKANLTTLRGIVMLTLGMMIAVAPLIAYATQTRDQAGASVPIGWVDYDNSAYSRMLLQNVSEQGIAHIVQGDEPALTASLKTGKLESVYVVHEGFEDAILGGRYEDTLTQKRSPYSSVAGIVSETVGSQVMHLWLAVTSADIARNYGDEAFAEQVFDDVMTDMSEPIMTIERLNEQGAVSAKSPLSDAAAASVHLLAVYACLYILLTLAMSGGSQDFYARLRSHASSPQSHRMALSAADTLFVLPCLLPALIAYGIAGDGRIIAPILAMFSLYVFAFGGVASLLCQIKSAVTHMLSITLIVVVNLAFGSLLVSLPSAGVVPKIAYLLPSKWLASFDTIGPAWSILGLCVCAAVYHALPFLLRRKRKI